MAFWARVMAGITAGRPPALRHLFQHGDTAMCLSMLPTALSRTLKCRMVDLRQSWSVRLDVHLRVLLRDLLADKNLDFSTAEQLVAQR